jgi:hypothetical protein
MKMKDLPKEERLKILAERQRIRRKTPEGKAYDKKYKSLTRWKYKDKMRESSKRHSKTLRGRYTSCRLSASKRKLVFTLTEEQVTHIVTQPCIYCNTFQYETSGIDRIDSSIGYIFENCAPCCFICNRMKSNYSAENFLEHCKKIADNNIK